MRMLRWQFRADYPHKHSYTHTRWHFEDERRPLTSRCPSTKHGRFFEKASETSVEVRDFISSSEVATDSAVCQACAVAAVLREVRTSPIRVTGGS